jgi:MFS family permease
MDIEKESSSPPKWFRAVSLGCAMFQNITLAGVIYGWASISDSLLVSQHGAGLPDNYIHQMFVIASFANFLSPIFLGFVLDKCGPRTCSIISLISISAGFALFSISDWESYRYFLPAMCLIAFGGPGIQNATIQLSNLFPDSKATATCMITGSFQLSFTVFTLFRNLWENWGWDYSSLFSGYLLVCLLNALISIFILPDKPYSADVFVADVGETKGAQKELKSMKFRLPSVMMKTNPSNIDYAQDKFVVKKNGDHETKRSIIALKDDTLRNQLCSGRFISLLLLFTISTFWMNLYIGTMGIQLGDSDLMGLEEQVQMGTTLTVIMTATVLAVPVIGWMMDNLGYSVTAGLMVSLGVAWSILLILSFHNVDYLVMSFIVYSLYRTCTFTFFFAYIADTLGFRFFGLVAGMQFLIAGIVGLAQAPAANWASGDCHKHRFQVHDRHEHQDSVCDLGEWLTLDYIMLFTLFSLYLFVYGDYKYRQQPPERTLSTFRGVRPANEATSLLSK